MWLLVMVGGVITARWSQKRRIPAYECNQSTTHKHQPPSRDHDEDTLKSRHHRHHPLRSLLTNRCHSLYNRPAAISPRRSSSPLSSPLDGPITRRHPPTNYEEALCRTQRARRMCRYCSFVCFQIRKRCKRGGCGESL